MQGIYAFKNRKNNKYYIGQSNNLEERYNQHKRNYNKENNKEYNKSLYQAFRKYGFENFDYIILIQGNNFTIEELNKLEIEYIEQFDSYYSGYNETLGGDYHFNNNKITKEQVLEIKELLLNSDKMFIDIQKEYPITISTISMINSGKVWNSIGNYTYPIRKDSYQHQRNKSPATAIFTDKEVLEIRELFVEKTLSELYNIYQDRISFSGLKKICYGVNHTWFPVYKKKQKQWYLNGTCIDYPLGWNAGSRAVIGTQLSFRKRSL